MTLEQQQSAYHSLRSKLGWRELRGFDGGKDCWCQRDGIAVWLGPTEGLNIGLKNSIGSGYCGLENRSSKGLNHPPRSKMMWDEIVRLWRDAYGRIGDFKLAARLAIILNELGVIK